MYAIGFKTLPGAHSSHNSQCKSPFWRQIESSKSTCINMSFDGILIVLVWCAYMNIVVGKVRSNMDSITQRCSTTTGLNFFLHFSAFVPTGNQLIVFNRLYRQRRLDLIVFYSLCYKCKCFLFFLFFLFLKHMDPEILNFVYLYLK